MNAYFFVAGCLAFAIGLVHSVLGELRIFHTLTERNLQAGSRLKLSHLRILRVTWHIATVFGWAFGALLLWLSQAEVSPGTLAFLRPTLAIAFSCASLLILLGTRGRHPGWVGLLATAIMVWLG